MIRILAFVPADGWAFLRDENLVEGVVRLIRPPYRFEGAGQFSDETAVAIGIEKHGFIAGPATEFCTVREVFQFLRDQHQQFQSELPVWNQDVDAPALLALAPLGIIEDCLDTIEKEWLPDGRLDPAGQLLSDIFVLSNIGLALRQRVAALLKQVWLLRKQGQRVAPAPRQLPRFESLPEVQNYANDRRTRHLLVAA